MMDLFAKCYETFIQDEIRDMGLYHGRRTAHHAGLQ